MVFSVDFELSAKDGNDDRLTSLTGDPVLHGVNFRIDAPDPVIALEFGVEKLRALEPAIGDLVRALEASVEPV